MKEGFTFNKASLKNIIFIDYIEYYNSKFLWRGTRKGPILLAKVERNTKLFWKILCIHVAMTSQWPYFERYGGANVLLKFYKTFLLSHAFWYLHFNHEPKLSEFMNKVTIIWKSCWNTRSVEVFVVITTVYCFGTNANNTKDWMAPSQKSRSDIVALRIWHTSSKGIRWVVIRYVALTLHMQGINVR